MVCRGCRGRGPSAEQVRGLNMGCMGVHGERGPSSAQVREPLLQGRCGGDHACGAWRGVQGEAHRRVDAGSVHGVCTGVHGERGPSAVQVRGAPCASQVREGGTMHGVQRERHTRRAGAWRGARGCMQGERPILSSGSAFPFGRALEGISSRLPQERGAPMAAPGKWGVGLQNATQPASTPAAGARAGRGREARGAARVPDRHVPGCAGGGWTSPGDPRARPPQTHAHST